MKSVYKIRFLIALIVFLFVILGFIGFFYPVKVLDLQLAPLLQRVFVDFSIISLIILAAILAITLFFGRFYCSTICPFGFLQELAALCFKNKNKNIKNYSVKYFILALILGTLAGGSSVLLRLFDPYSVFGSAITFSIFGLIFTFAVLILTFFKNRFFCTNLCPIGAFLGIISKFSLKKIVINKDRCVSCTMCEKNCPSGCIDLKEKTIQNETCVRCLKCLNVCPKNAISFSKEEKEAKFSLKRRQIILAASLVATFGAIAKITIDFKDNLVEKVKNIILPAGAISKEKFNNKCLNCNLCVKNCPNKILVKADEIFPCVYIDYSKGEKYCKFDCNKCGKVCPSGAIKRLSLEEKQNLRIAMAMIIKDKCHKCNACVEICPKGAIIKVEGSAPILDAKKCIGCGACKSTCYHDAIEIFSVKEQKLI